MLSHFSRVWLFATAAIITGQAPLSLGFSTQEYWSGLPCPSPGNLPNPGVKPASFTTPPFPALAGGFFTTRATWGAPSVAVVNVKWRVWGTCYLMPSAESSTFLQCNWAVKHLIKSKDRMVISACQFNGALLWLLSLGCECDPKHSGKWDPSLFCRFKKKDKLLKNVPCLSWKCTFNRIEPEALQGLPW